MKKSNGEGVRIPKTLFGYATDLIAVVLKRSGTRESVLYALYAKSPYKTGAQKKLRTTDTQQRTVTTKNHTFYASSRIR